MGSNKDDDFPNIDGLFNLDDMESTKEESINVLFLGQKKTFKKLRPTLSSFDFINLFKVKTIDEAIELLLRDIYAIVIIEDELKDIDIVTVSRIIRINHPLARIVVLTQTRRSLYIADFINLGSVDAIIPKPIKQDIVLNIITEQHAKFSITKMLTSFVSSPPKLSAASYLLLDPSLSFNEDEPVRFVGMIIAYNSVPRYSRFFEELLAKDEILFAGYLSGITMLGREMLDTKEPLKEINFGGVSVIFRFYEDLQFSIFVRNLSKHNYQAAESVISDIIETMVAAANSYLQSFDRISKVIHSQLHVITDKFEEANKEVIYRKELELSKTSIESQLVLLYGTDEKNLKNMGRYLSRQLSSSIAMTTDHDEANSILKEPNCAVICIDSDIENLPETQHPIDFADFAKDEIPSIQVIYLMRDRRASHPIIEALNRGAIDCLIGYKIPRYELVSWVKLYLQKAIEIMQQTENIEGIGSALDGATIAKSMIRQNEDSYLHEKIPQLDGIFISENEFPVFQIFWENRSRIQFDDQMMAGIVASLESVGDEMFQDGTSVGAVELGNANILVQHRENFNIAFFIENLDAQNTHLITQSLPQFADRFLKVLIENKSNLKSDLAKARLDTISNNIYGEFIEQFSELS